MKFLLNTVFIARDVLSVLLPMVVMIYMAVSPALDDALPPILLGVLTVVVAITVFVAFRLSTNQLMRRLGALYRSYEWSDRS